MYLIPYAYVFKNDPETYHAHIYDANFPEIHGDYVFVDYYCGEPKCDCGDVSIDVCKVLENQTELAIQLKIDLSTPTPSLKLTNETLSLGQQALLVHVLQRIMQDEEQIAIYRKHYKQIKQVAANRSHSKHRRVWKAARSNDITFSL